MPELKEMKCVPCRAGEPTVSQEELERYLGQITGWKVVERDGEQRLEKVYKFKNFAQALEFTNQIGTLAEEQDHHPAILTEWGRVTLSWWTHRIHGLHRNDFIMAAKSDEIYQ